MRPIYRFTYDSKIYVFGMATAYTLPEFKEFLDQFKSITLHDNTKVKVSDLQDIRVYNVTCSTYLFMLENGQLVKNI